VSQRKLTLRPRGLVTDPSELSSAPPGAMAEAQNVVIRRDGVIEPRPGFKLNYSASANQSTRKIVPLSTESLFYVYDTAGTPYFRLIKESDESAFSITQYPGADDFKPPTPFRIGPRAAEARGSTYLTHHGSTLKIDDLTGSTSVGAGLLPPNVQAVGGTINATQFAVEVGHVVGYRFVLVREDANGYMVRSAPTETHYASDFAGTDSYQVTFRLYDVTNYVAGSTISEAGAVKAGDVVEVYRSRQTESGTTPEDELFLATSVTVPSSLTALSSDFQSATVDYLEFTDVTPEASLGASLYTNPSQQGILGSNRRPPAAHDMVNFKRSLFYFNLKLPHRIEVTLENNLSLANSAKTASITTGTNTLTLSSGSWDSDVHVGLYVTTDTTVIDSSARLNPPAIAGTVFPAATQIVSVSGADATLSENALSTFGPGNVYLWGHVTVDGTPLYHSNDTYRGVSGPGFTATNQFFSQAFNGAEFSGTVSTAEITAASLATAINENVLNVTATILESDGGGKRTLLIEKHSEDDNDFTFTTYQGNYASFSPDVSSGLTSEAETDPGGFAWSKTDLPEAVPLANYAFVNDRNEAILGAKALRDSIMVFTERGVYRISRYAEEAPRVDVLDPSLVLIAPNTLQVLENVVYAWTNRGVVAITEGGSVTEISDPFITDELRSFEVNLIANPTTAGAPNAAANSPSNEYVLTVANSGATGTQSETMYVWNTKTQSWVKWLIDSYGIAYDATNQRLLIADGDVDEERTGDTYYSADNSSAVTLSAMSGASGTSSASLVAGRALEQSGALYVVVTGGTSFTVDRAGLVNGAATQYLSFVSRVGFLASHQGHPDAAKTWEAAQWLFRSTEDLYRLTFEYHSSLSATPWTELKILSSDVAARAQSLRHWVPREHAWSERLYPVLEIESAGSSWKLEGLAIESDTESTAHRRQAS